MFLSEGERWAVRGSASYTAEQFPQLGSGEPLATWPSATCVPHRAVTAALGYCLGHMVTGARVLTPGWQSVLSRSVDTSAM